MLLVPHSRGRASIPGRGSEELRARTPRSAMRRVFSEQRRQRLHPGGPRSAWAHPGGMRVRSAAGDGRCVRRCPARTAPPARSPARQGARVRQASCIGVSADRSSAPSTAPRAAGRSYSATTTIARHAASADAVGCAAGVDQGSAAGDARRRHCAPSRSGTRRGRRGTRPMSIRAGRNRAPTPCRCRCASAHRPAPQWNVIAMNGPIAATRRRRRRGGRASDRRGAHQVEVAMVDQAHEPVSTLPVVPVPMSK